MDEVTKQKFAGRVQQIFGGRSGSPGGGNQGRFLRALEQQRLARQNKLQEEKGGETPPPAPEKTKSPQEVAPRQPSGENEEDSYEEKRKKRFSKYID